MFGSADLCPADLATRRRISRIKAAAKQIEKARAQREALEAARR
jgi:hypothetical protein